MTEVKYGSVFQRSMQLPCRHIFALRQKLGMSLFDNQCCADRWTVSNYRANQRIFCDLAAAPSVEITSSSFSKQRKLTQYEKFRKATVLTTELATVISVPG